MKKRYHPLSLDLHSLEVFHRVVEASSFSEAAKALGLSQPTVSQVVAALEDALGAILLDRGGKRARPTAAGKALDLYAVRMLRLREEAQRAVAAAEGAVAGRLTVAASTIPGSYVVPKAVKAMLEKHPAVTVEVRSADTRESERMVADEEAELGITGAAPIDRRVSGKPILADELVLVGPPGDPFAAAGSKGVPLKALEGRNFVMREQGSGSLDAIESVLRPAGLQDLVIVARFGSTEAVLEAVMAGVGISWVSKRAASRGLARGDLIQVRVRGFSVERDIYLVLRRGRTPSPAAAAFVGVLEGGAW